MKHNLSEQPNMKYLLLLFIFVAVGTMAQQVRPEGSSTSNESIESIEQLLNYGKASIALPRINEAIQLGNEMLSLPYHAYHVLHDEFR